jgi:hypothetical protein
LRKKNSAFDSGTKRTDFNFFIFWLKGGKKKGEKNKEEKQEKNHRRRCHHRLLLLCQREKGSRLSMGRVIYAAPLQQNVSCSSRNNHIKGGQQPARYYYYCHSGCGFSFLLLLLLLL